jgi:hypothetical protein
MTGSEAADALQRSCNVQTARPSNQNCDCGEGGDRSGATQRSVHQAPQRPLVSADRFGVAREVHAVGLDRPRDVLDLLRPELLEDEAEFVEHLISVNATDADPARLGKRLKARGYIDAVAKDVLPR